VGEVDLFGDFSFPPLLQELAQSLGDQSTATYAHFLSSLVGLQH